MIVYHGTVHYANQHEMLSLYLAVKLLQRRGRKVRLVRLGETELGGVDPRSLGALREGVIELGSVGWREIPGFLALADAFVQPGRRRRLQPLPAAVEAARVPRHGRPVVLPDCNIGHDLVDGSNALLLSEGDGLEIAARVEQLIDDPELRGTARRAAPGASRSSELDWERQLARPRPLPATGSHAPTPPAPAGARRRWPPDGGLARDRASPGGPAPRRGGG